MPEGLPLIDIGEVYLYHGRSDCPKRVSNGNRGMCKAPCVENDAIVPVSHAMDFINQVAFVIGLKIMQVVIRKRIFQLYKVIVKGTGAVHVRLPDTKQV